MSGARRTHAPCERRRPPRAEGELVEQSGVERQGRPQEGRREVLGELGIRMWPRFSAAHPLEIYRILHGNIRFFRPQMFMGPALSL